MTRNTNFRLQTISSRDRKRLQSGINQGVIDWLAVEDITDGNVGSGGQKYKRLRPELDEVLVVSDHRTQPKGMVATQQVARYEGRFFLNGRRYRGSHNLLTTVGLRLADGTMIWGYECTWVAFHPNGPECGEGAQRCRLVHAHEGPHKP